MLKSIAKASLLAAALSMPLSFSAGQAEVKTEFKVCWSIYVGWMPWGYLETSGIMDKWAEKYGIDVEIVQINDYVESINQYTAGEYRRLLDDQYGRAVHSRRRRGRHHGADRRRLFQRQ
jgi:NitT/TauT family transport system substrate-binding protein